MVEYEIIENTTRSQNGEPPVSYIGGDDGWPTEMEQKGTERKFEMGHSIPLRHAKECLTHF